MEELKRIAKENNNLLNEIKSMLVQFLSPEHIQKQEIINLLTNILANILVYNQKR
jgi:hypothetical protein